MSRIDGGKQLTPKESVILELIGQGMSVKQVAAELGRRGDHTAPATVQGHVNRIASKLPNPYHLTPIAAIRHYFGERMAS